MDLDAITSRTERGRKADLRLIQAARDEKDALAGKASGAKKQPSKNKKPPDSRAA